MIIKTLSAQTENELQELLDRIPESVRFKFKRQKEFLESERNVLDSENDYNDKDPEEIITDDEEVEDNMTTLETTRARSSVFLKFCSWACLTKTFLQSIWKIRDDQYSFADPTPTEMSHVNIGYDDIYDI